jgi:hypothetical protein
MASYPTEGAEVHREHGFRYFPIGALESTLVNFEYVAEGEVPPFTAYALDEKGLIDGAVLLELPPVLTRK